MFKKKKKQISDEDNSGSIDVTELKYLMLSFGQKLSDKKINKLLKKIDKNQDGQIDYDEFKVFIKQFFE